MDDVCVCIDVTSTLSISFIAGIAGGVLALLIVIMIIIVVVCVLKRRKYFVNINQGCI